MPPKLNKNILIEWGTGEDKSTAEWNFKSLGASKTFVKITNYDFQCEESKLTSQVIDSVGGFTLVLAGLKAWMEHGVELNLIGDKFPKELMEE